MFGFGLKSCKAQEERDLLKVIVMALEEDLKDIAYLVDYENFLL